MDAINTGLINLHTFDRLRSWFQYREYDIMIVKQIEKHHPVSSHVCFSQKGVNNND